MNPRKILPSTTGILVWQSPANTLYPVLWASQQWICRERQRKRVLQVTFQQFQTSAEPTPGQLNPAGIPRSIPVVGLQVDHGKCKGGTWTRHVHVDGVSFLGKHREHFPQVHLEGNLSPKSWRHLPDFQLKWARAGTTHLDLVTGRFVLLPVHSRLESPVSPHHVLVELLGNVEVRHPNQVTAMLRNGRKEKHGSAFL